MFKHISDNKVVEFEPKDEFASVLISDKRGSFFSQGLTSNHSFYHGLLTQYPEGDEWTMSKFIERIDVRHDKIEKKKDYLMYTNSENRCSIRFISERALLIESDERVSVSITFDPRKIYDFSEFGRDIKMYEEQGFTIIEYNKHSGDKHEYSLFLGIKGAASCEQKDEWMKREYGFDAKRGGKGEWHVNRGIDVSFEKDLLLVQHHDKEELLRIMSEEEDIMHDGTGKLNDMIEDDETSMAYSCAINSLNELSVSDEGIYAGYYWFFQFWTRDEAISLGGAIREEKRELVRNTLKRHLGSFLDDGRVSNRFPHSQLGSADGVGWSILRLEECKSFFNEDEMKELVQKMERSIRDLEESYGEEGMLKNGPKETWMDTNGSTDDVRAGYRIEIQALTLNHYKVLGKITENEEFINKEDDLRHRVRELMFDDGMLADGVDEELNPDHTARPNIFLAYYIYPQLLEPEQWEVAFDYALERIWLDWGGLSTIDKNSPLFKEEYTGENDESYHRGDSWFFVNNVAAIAMHRLNNEKYKSYIDKIIKASSNDILYHGMLGGASEVSSAKEQRAEGALHQAWSACTFIELMHELFGE